jgi:thiosulfate dehydrogenase (quinone) large subunit
MVWLGIRRHVGLASGGRTRFDRAVVTRVPAAAGARVDDSRLGWLLIAAVRVSVAFLWIQNAYWKVPPHFGADHTPPDGLYEMTRDAVDRPVFGPYAWIVEHVVLPNFGFFGWLLLLTEVSLGAFLLVGLATRLWAVVGAGQSVVIALSVLKTPNVWHWSYYLMFGVHLLLFAVAAGRAGGLDGVLRPAWTASNGRLARLLLRVS